MKTRETKQKDLAALTESLQNSKSAMVVSFSKLSVTKDQEFRSSLRKAGAEYKVVKNTLARIAVKGTPFEPATEHFKGVTAIAWTQNDPVILTKAISKFMKENADTYTFKTGVLDGRLLDLSQVTQIASLPSKEELISKLLYVLNAQAQRIVTVINAVPRDLAVVIKQIGEKAPEGGEAAPVEAKSEEPAAAPAQAAETGPAEDAPVAADSPNAETAAEPTSGEVAETVEAASTESQSEAAVAEPDEKSEELLNATPDAATEAGAEAIAAAPEDTAEEVVASSTSVDTEAGSEAAAAAPDDKAEEMLHPPADDTEERA